MQCKDILLDSTVVNRSSNGIAMEETDNLLRSDINSFPIDELLSKLQTSLQGLSRSQRKIAREANGVNKIPAPNYCPSWLCCLLPCLKKTKKIKYFNECTPDFAEVKIDGKWVKIDPMGVVVGDILKITPGSPVPADIRVIEVFTVHIFCHSSHYDL